MSASKKSSLPLADEVRSSFLKIPGPGDNIALNQDENYECGQVKERFRRLHWSELTADLVQKEPDANSFFSPEAFCFFLPGYLLLALENRDSLDVSLHSLLSALAGPVHQEERLTLLTHAQLRVVLRVLETISPDIDDPYYWEFERAKEGVLEYLTRPEICPDSTSV